MKTETPKPELYRKVIIKSADDLPKETGPYHVCDKIYSYQSDYYNNDDNSKKRWLEKYSWYLIEHPLEEETQGKPTDYDIEQWARGLCYNPEENPKDDTSLVKLRYLTLIEGAKDMRNGLIHPSRSEQPEQGRKEPAGYTEQEYHLNCVKCVRMFWSKEAFPNPQLCPVCKTVEQGSRKIHMASDEYYGLTTTDLDSSLKCHSCGEPISGYCDRCQHLWES